MSDPQAEFVYLIGSEAGSLVKIGRSNNVAKRLGKIQHMSPVRLNVLWHVEGDAELESALHRLFRLYRSHGEWFDFGGHDPVQVVSDAIMDGLHETATEPIVLGSPDLLNQGDVVRILRSDWSGPRYGVVRAITLTPVVHTIRGYLVGPPQGSPHRARWFFGPDALLLVPDPATTCPDLKELWETMPVKILA